MSRAKLWTIRLMTPEGDRVIEGTGRTNKERELRAACTETARTTGGEVWVTESGARAWQVWDCRKGDTFATRGRVVQKDQQ